MRRIEKVEHNGRIVAYRRAGVLFEVGDHVRLTKRIDPRGLIQRTAIIDVVYKSIRGGVRLNEPLAGFVSWNVDDLAKVSRKRHSRPLFRRQTA